jgi:hypothetical protein
MDEIITVKRTSPTLFNAFTEDYSVVVREGITYINGMPGSYVRAWSADGSARQVFGSWTGSYGGALHRSVDAVQPEDKARWIARDLRIPFLDKTASRLGALSRRPARFAAISTSSPHTKCVDGEAKATVDRPSRNRDAVDALVAAFQAAVSASIKASSIAAA